MDDVENRPEVRLVPTNRPVEMMIDLTQHNPEWFKGKRILNSGSGKSHWGLDLTVKYGVVARDFQNFDISHNDKSLLRRKAGEAFLGEMSGDVEEDLPYPDDEFDLVWCSVAPKNYAEFARVLKPGGKAYIVPVSEVVASMDYGQETRWKLAEELSGGMDVTAIELPEETCKRYSIGNRMLVLSKPGVRINH